jgi:hypothetical protein
VPGLSVRLGWRPNLCPLSGLSVPLGDLLLSPMLWNEKAASVGGYRDSLGRDYPRWPTLCHKLSRVVKHYLHQHNTPSLASSFKSLTRASRIRTSRSS